MRKKFLTILAVLLLAATPVLWLVPTAKAALPSEYELVTAPPESWGFREEANSISISADGRYVAYLASSAYIVTNQMDHILLYDRQSQTTRLVSHAYGSDTTRGNGNSFSPVISGDGRYVVFTSYATNLGEAPASGKSGIYLYDVATGEVTLLDTSIGWATYGLSISSDGQKLAYTDDDGDVHLFDVTTGQDSQLTIDANQQSGVEFQTYYAESNLSADGTKVLLRRIIEISYDIGPSSEIFLYDLTNSSVTEIGDGPSGSYSLGGSISADGRYVSYAHGGDEPAGILLYDTQTQETSQIAPSNTDWQTHISRNGEFIAYAGAVSGNYQSRSVILLDRTTGEVRALCTGATDYCSLNGRDVISDNGDVALLYRDSSVQGPTKGYVYGGMIADTVPPTLGVSVFSANPKPTTGSTTLVVSATDGEGSGVAAGEYFLGDNDPGQGNGAAMDFDGTNLTTTFGTDFPAGVYKVTVRAVDSVGNWSEPVSDYLVVYNPDGPRVTGKRTVVPSLANDDVLPGLINTSQNDKATFAFNVKYNNQGQISGNSDLQFKYKTGTHCNGNHPQNCHSLELNATSIAWLTTQGANDSTGIFQGTATMKVDGQTSTVQFRVTGLDGQRLDPESDDHFTLKIYAEGANPNTDEPLYQVSSVVTRGNIRIIF